MKPYNNFYSHSFSGSSSARNRNREHLRHNLIPNAKSSRRNRYNNQQRAVNQKNNRRGKEKSDNLSNKTQKNVETKLPRHPSLDGFELHGGNREGKSSSSDRTSMKSSTSEVISIKEEKENKKVDNEELENASKNEFVKQNLKNPT